MAAAHGGTIPRHTLPLELLEARVRLAARAGLRQDVAAQGDRLAVVTGQLLGGGRTAEGPLPLSQLLVGLSRQDVADPEARLELECPAGVGERRVEVAAAKRDLRRHRVLNRVQGIAFDGRLSGGKGLGVPLMLA